MYPNDNLKDYGESGIENNLEKEKEWKKKAKKIKEVIHIEFNMDDDDKSKRRMLKTEIQKGKFGQKRKQYSNMNLVVRMRVENKPG